MAIHHLKDGQDFGSSPEHFPSSFGFHGSAEDGAPKVPAPHARRGEPVEVMAHGGEAHLHPHGHHVMRVDHWSDGRIVHHHDHGGHTVHHPDGRITHHHHDASPVAAEAHGGGIEQMHDESEYAHRARGGWSEGEDDRQDKAMVTRGVHEHEAHLHHGEHETDLHLARGGRIGGARAKLPRGMKPTTMRRHSPIGQEPNAHAMMATPSRDDPTQGGEMGYGVQPSDEADPAGSDQGIEQMRRGGRAKGWE